jgi:hypothetical protein
MPYKSVPWEIKLVKVFFWLLFDKDLNCAYPLEGANQDSINKHSKRTYHHG